MHNVIATINAAGLSVPAGHYSHAVVAGGFVFVSGQLPLDRAGRAVTDVGFEEQVEQALANVFAILRDSGSAPELVVRVTAYIVGVERWPAFNKVYAQYFGTHRPARAIVPVPALHYGCLVEIDALAVVAGSGR